MTERARLLFTGPFHSTHRARALDCLIAHANAGARNILYIVASPAAKRRAVADLLFRRPALFGIEVVTLRGLPEKLARRAHGKAPGRIESVVEDLLLERALRVASGGRFAGATPMSGLTNRASSTIGALERSGATAALLAEALVDVPHSAAAEVLANAWESLTRRRGRHGATEAERLAWATGLLRDAPKALAGVDAIVLEDVPLLSAAERSLVSAVIDAAPGVVIACYGHVPTLPDGPAARSLAVLRSLATWTEEVLPTATAAPSPRIAVLEAISDLGEVRLAARVVRRHLDAGVPPNEIALVVHGAARRYAELVRELFTPAGIPVAAARPRSIAHSSIGGTLLRLLELAILPDRATRETSLAVARGGHVGLGTRAADRLQRNVVVKGYLGLDGWDDLAVEALGADSTNRINRLKRAVADARTSFGSVATPKEAAAVVRRLAKDVRLVNNAWSSRRRAMGAGDATLAAASTAAVREDNLAWELIDHVLDATVPAMMDIAPPSAVQSGLEYAGAWLAMLDRALRETTVMAERAPANAVQLRGTSAGCEAPARVTIMLGLVEKVFPRQAVQDPFIDDALRTTLRERLGWELATSDELMERERECFARAVSSATEALYLSWSALDGEGRPAVRSFFIDDLLMTASGEPAIGAERLDGATAVPRVSDAVTRSDLVASIAHDVWQYLPRTDDSATRRGAAFRAIEALARREADGAAVVRHGRRVSQRPALGDVMPETAPHRTLTLSASQLKSLAQCTYKHFVEKVLTPSDLTPPEYDALQKGSLVHNAIMHWSTVLDGWRRGDAALPELHDWFRAQVAAWSPALRGGDRTARTTEADLERLDELLRAELAALRAPGVAQPAFAELAFGEDMGAHGARDAASMPAPFELAVATSVGDTVVRFRGSMDRVDVVTVGGTRYGVILDYKTGRTSKYYADDMMQGHDLQLRLYLLALQQFWGIVPVGALYLGFGDGVRRGAVRADFVDRIAGIDPAAVKLLEPGEWTPFVDGTRGLIGQLVDRLVRLDITPAPRDNKCGFCTLVPICRYERGAAEAVNV